MRRICNAVWPVRSGGCPPGALLAGPASAAPGPTGDHHPALSPAAGGVACASTGRRPRPRRARPAPPRAGSRAGAACPPCAWARPRSATPRAMCPAASSTSCRWVRVRLRAPNWTPSVTTAGGWNDVSLVSFDTRRRRPRPVQQLLWGRPRRLRVLGRRPPRRTCSLGVAPPGQPCPAVVVATAVISGPTSLAPTWRSPTPRSGRPGLVRAAHRRSLVASDDFPDGGNVVIDRPAVPDRRRATARPATSSPTSTGSGRRAAQGGLAREQPWFDRDVRGRSQRPPRWPRSGSVRRSRPTTCVRFGPTHRTHRLQDAVEPGHLRVSRRQRKPPGRVPTARPRSRWRSSTPAPATHPELAGKLVNPFNATDLSTDVTDSEGHGTDGRADRRAHQQHDRPGGAGLGHHGDADQGR
jgi:hypothetical protein